MARKTIKVDYLARVEGEGAFKVVVRDDLSAEEARVLLTSPGVLYVREDRDKKAS